MRNLMQITEESNGLYTVVVPPIHSLHFGFIIPLRTYVLIQNPTFAVTDKLSRSLAEYYESNVFTTAECFIRSIEYDLCLTSEDFLIAEAIHFKHGLNMACSEKKFPRNLNLSAISKHSLSDVMLKNNILFAMHRPDGGESSLFSSPTRKAVENIVDSLKRAGLD